MAAGGAERLAVLQASEFAARGHSVGVVTFSDTPDAFALPGGVKRYRLNFALKSQKNPFMFIKKVLLTRRVLKDFRPDVCLSHMMGFVCFVCALFSYKSIYVEHSTIGAYKLSWKKRWAVRKAAAVCALTKKEKEGLQSLGVDSVVINNPAIKIMPFKDERPAFLSAPRNVISVGRFVEEKGFDLLLEAWLMVKERRGWRLSIIGYGKLKEELEKIIKEKNVTDAQIITSPEDMGVVYKYADICAVASRTETFSLVTFEAMAWGEAVVSFNVGAAGEIIEHGVSGVLVEPGRPDALAHELELLMQNETARKEMGSCATYVTEKYSAANYITAYENLIKQVVQSNAAVS